MGPNPRQTGFGIAGSARVGGSARRPSPGGGTDPGFWGAIFFEFFPEKWLFGGMFVKRKSTFGEVVVEKMDFFGKFL